MKLFCKHKWEVLHKETTKSLYEVAVESMRGKMVGKTTIPWQMCETKKKYIQICSCTKCGKLIKFVTSND